MNAPGSPALRGWAWLAAALLLSLAPGAAAGAVCGGLLALYLPGRALRLCLRPHSGAGGAMDCLEDVAASLAVSPLVLRLASVVVPLDRQHVLSTLAGVSLGLFVIAALRPGRDLAPNRGASRPLLAVVAVTVLLLAPGLWIGTTEDGGETYVKGWDLNNHLAMAESIAARGLPPVNPFLATDAPFYYHTFFHVLLGSVLLVAGEGVRSYALIALLTLLIAAAFLGVFHRLVAETTGDERVAHLSLPLVSLVGGFDVVPMAEKALFMGERTIAPVAFFLRHWNVDGWVSNQGMLVPSLFADFYWAPHAVAAMVVLLLALRYLGRSGEDPWAAGAAGVCLASMAGYNGYIALGGALTLLLVRGVGAARALASGGADARARLRRDGLAGGLAIVLSLPVLHLYLGQDRGPAKFRWAGPGVLLPVQLLLEFGPALLLGLTGLALLRRRRYDRARLAPFLAMAGVTLPSIVLVASTGENNDLAMRMSMLLWCGLAAPGGVALAHLFPPRPAPPRSTRVVRAAFLVALAAGALSVAWFAVGAAVAKPAFPPDEVASGRWVRLHVAPGLRAQGSPLRDNPDLVYLTGRPAVLSDTWAGRLFYASPEDFALRMSALREAFSTEDGAAACALLRSLRIAVVVVGPPEERDFPILAGPDPRPCLVESFRQGTYRVFRLGP